MAVLNELCRKARAKNLLVCITFGKGRDEIGSAGGTVPATLSLTVGGPASFGAFTPGVARDYLASTTANVISTAGDATLAPTTAPMPPSAALRAPRR